MTLLAAGQVILLAACQADHPVAPADLAPGPVKLVKGKRDARFDAVSVLLKIRMPDGRTQICSGTFIEQNIILSAAHCVESMAHFLGQDEIQVETMQGPDDDKALRPAALGRRIELHPQYRSDPRRYDLALILIEKTGSAAQGVDPKNAAGGFAIPEIVAENWIPEKTDSLILTGAGVKSGVLENEGEIPGSEAATFQGDLRIERSGYFEVLADWVSQTALVAGDLLNLSAQESSAWLCAGDSGGGFFLEKDGKIYLAAVNSRARLYVYQGMTLCLTSGMIVTPLSPYRMWIQEVIQRFGR